MHANPHGHDQHRTPHLIAGSLSAQDRDAVFAWIATASTARRVAQYRATLLTDGQRRVHKGRSCMTIRFVWPVACMLLAAGPAVAGTGGSTRPPVTSVPEPAALALLGIGVAGILAIRNRGKKTESGAITATGRHSRLPARAEKAPRRGVAGRGSISGVGKASPPATRVIAFQKAASNWPRKASSHPARLNLPRSELLDPSFWMRFSAMWRRMARL
jgi:PEP-CTERM motif